MARNQIEAEYQRAQLDALRQELPLLKAKQSAYQGLEKAVGVMMEEAKTGRVLTFPTIMVVIGPALQTLAAVESEYLNRNIGVIQTAVDNADRMVQPIG